MGLRAAGLLALVIGLSPACTSSTQPCAADDECDPAQRCVGGVCVASDRPDAAVASDAGLPRDAGRSDGAVPDAAQSVDASAPHDAGTTARDAAVPIDAGPPRDAGGQPLQCQPDSNHDELTASELPVALGLPVRFYESRSDAGITVDLNGDMLPDGGTVWRFDAPVPGDTLIEMEATALADQWFASSFPNGRYVVPLDGTGANLGVFRRDDTGIQLFGVASTQPDDTVLTYDPPVTVVPYPLRLGANFSTETHVSGTFEGNPFYVSDDVWDLTVDGRGVVYTRAGPFAALRVRVVQQVAVPVPWWPFELSYRYVRHTFMSPCIGQVALVESFEGETELLFTRAALLRRLGLGQ